MSLIPTLDSLEVRLADRLPKGIRFIIYHVSTPPAECDAIFSAPPGKEDERTQCETQYLSLAVEADSRQYIVFGIEILIYTTDRLTTLFISKADSTGCLHLLSLPKGSPSPLRFVTVTFLEWLVETHQRPSIRLVVSLFARAQHSYLFPGSAENPNKHVLDDRGLIRWWCRNLDPVLRTVPDEKELPPIIDGAVERDVGALKSRGFLVVPGCDLRETRSFFPKSATDHLESRWSATDPLQELDKSPLLPERCLIPRFPDDPKARYMDELDDELPEFQVMENDRPSKETNFGRWRSVKSLKQFWEMMSFRQECSSGRLVGFIWVVFTPRDLLGDKFKIDTALASSPRHAAAETVLPTSAPSQAQPSTFVRPEMVLLSNSAHDIPITPPRFSQPRLEEPATDIPDASPKPEIDRKTNLRAEPLIMHPKDTIDPSAQQPDKALSSWPQSSRGEIVLLEKEYARTHKLLLQLDFCSEEATERSTKTWNDAIAAVAGAKNCGQPVVGKISVSEEMQSSATTAPVLLTAGLLRKKKRINGGDESNPERVEGRNGDAKANVLAEGLVRKKAKV